MNAMGINGDKADSTSIETKPPHMNATRCLETAESNIRSQAEPKPLEKSETHIELNYKRSIKTSAKGSICVTIHF